MFYGHPDRVKDFRIVVHSDGTFTATCKACGVTIKTAEKNGLVWYVCPGCNLPPSFQPVGNVKRDIVLAEQRAGAYECELFFLSQLLQDPHHRTMLRFMAAQSTVHHMPNKSLLADRGRVPGFSGLTCSGRLNAVRHQPASFAWTLLPVLLCQRRLEQFTSYPAEAMIEWKPVDVLTCLETNHRSTRKLRRIGIQCQSKRISDRTRNLALCQ